MVYLYIIPQISLPITTVIYSNTGSNIKPYINPNKCSCHCNSSGNSHHTSTYTGSFPITIIGESNTNSEINPYIKSNKSAYYFNSNCKSHKTFTYICLRK